MPDLKGSPNVGKKFNQEETNSSPNVYPAGLKKGETETANALIFSLMKHPESRSSFYLVMTPSYAASRQFSFVPCGWVAR
jgi:hypothetical protein